MKNKVQFLALGKQPITNNFLTKKNPKNEFFYNLNLIFYNSTKLVSLGKFIPPKKMFNKKYAHRASASITMRKAYKSLAQKIKNKFNPKSILEIGSGPGTLTHELVQRSGNVLALEIDESLIHIAKKNYKSTAGCIAVSKKNLREIIKNINKKTTVNIN